MVFSTYVAWPSDFRPETGIAPGDPCPLFFAAGLQRKQRENSGVLTVFFVVEPAAIEDFRGKPEVAR